MKKLTYLLVVLLAVTACSVESLDSAEELVILDAKTDKSVNAQDNQKESFDVPTLTLGENTSETELEVVVTPGTTGALGGFRLRWMTSEDYANYGWGEDEEVIGDEMCQQMFQVTGNNDSFSLESGETFNFLLSKYIEGTGESCDRALTCGMDYVFKVEALNDSGKDGLQKSGWSETFPFSTSNCTIVECEAGYMFGQLPFNEIGTSKNWGWAEYFDFTTDEDGFRNIQHKNDILGNVTISYSSEDKSISVVEGEGVNITHLYLSDNRPTDTNAPGQFDKTQNFSDEDGKFWMIIKADVCE